MNGGGAGAAPPVRGAGHVELRAHARRRHRLCRRAAAGGSEGGRPGAPLEAVVRSAEFFNCNPNLAGLALGATVRAEYEASPGAQIARLRTALCSPLGALGDQFFWAGLSAGTGRVPRSSRWCSAPGGGRSSACWWRTTSSASGPGCWSLRTGFAAGMGVGAAIGGSWVPRADRAGGPAAGFAIGVAVPIVAGWYLAGFGWTGAARGRAGRRARHRGQPVVRPALTSVPLRAGRGHGAPPPVSRRRDGDRAGSQHRQPGRAPRAPGGAHRPRGQQLLRRDRARPRTA